MQNCEVRPLPYEQAILWFKKRHYAGRIPSVSYAFGLYQNKALIGVVSFGTPASSTLLRGVCGEDNAKYVLELNRLIVEDSAPKNAASFLISKGLKLLPKPSIVVSYADTAQGHVGYIYQATNALYTGLSSKFVDPKVKGLEHQHHATYANGLTNAQLKEKFGDRLYFVQRPRKHRYVYLVGCSKRIQQALRYPVQSYPKGESKRYDASADILTQQLLL